MSRICFLALILPMLVVVPTASAQQTEPPPPVEVSHLVGPLHLMRCNGNVQMVASVGEDGILLVDTGYAGTAAAVRDALTEFDSGPVRVIINTHGDGDHVGANGILSEQAVIIAHPAVRRQMSTYFALPPRNVPGLPTVTLKDEATVHFNGDTIRLMPMPGGHTAADVVVHFSRSRVACIGDLLMTGTFPNADPSRGGDARRLAEVLRDVFRTLPADTTLVPGHGETLAMADLQTYIDLIDDTLAAVRKEVATGRSLDEIVQRRPLDPWADWESPEDGLTFENWTAELYASITGKPRRSICAPMTEALARNSADAAVAIYRRLATDEPENWDFAENQLNALGYQLLFRDMVDEAIAVFRLNVEAYPGEFNTYDSLGEAYMVAGESELAITNYQRSLELNPDNTNATAMLARLTGE